jgi:error-prone DNA polymerase
MLRLFRDAPEAIEETLVLSDALSFSLDELRYEYPDEEVQGFDNAQDALAHLTYEGAARRYPAGIPDKVRDNLEHELKLIAQLQYASYFLTVHDIVRFARSQGILCQGRGSAANSAVCFCLGVTEVDPDRADLLFERFISPERREPPDIDVDFEHERREEVIQYIYGKYGRDRAGIAATVISYRGRSAIREVGKVFGLSEDAIGALSSSIWGGGGGAVSKDAVTRTGLDPHSRRMRQILALAREINSFPRHLSQHVGGFVITRSRLDEVMPIGNAAMDDRTFVEWDKDDLDALGILKIDVLGLGMLSCLRKALDLLDGHYGERWTLASIPPEDPAVYNMLGRADSLGVFQVESRAQMTMLPRLKPKNFYDLVIEVAIVRPGPIQGDMVHPYLRRRRGQEQVTYPSKALEAVLAKTLGVPVVPGAGDEDRDRRRRFHTFRSRQASPRHGNLQARRHHWHVSTQDDRRHAGQRLRARFCRALFPADRRLRRIRLSRKPRGELCATGLCLGLAEMPLSGCLWRSTFERAADGFLRAGPDCARYARTRCRGAPAGHKSLALGFNARTGSPRGRVHA